LNPSDYDTKKYLVDYCNQFCINIDALNEVGHDIQLDAEGKLIGEDNNKMTIKVSTISNPTGEKPQPPPTGPSGG